MHALTDGFGREFLYLRLSLTEVCNFRCQYCLPDGYHCEHETPDLNLDEIRRIVSAFAALGLWKVRLTGGEPSVRRDLGEIMRTVAAIPGVRRLAMTTNGYRLRKDAAEWHAAGLNALNVSIDSLDPRLFASLTGHDRLQDLLAGVDHALTLGFDSIKVNAVLLRGYNSDDLERFLAWIRPRNLSLRFIELMQTGNNLEYFHKHHASADLLRAQLLTRGWTRRPREDGAGPAEVYTHPDYLGSIGLIAPYSPDFCAGCNRLRITAKGALNLCLFSEHGIDLRPLLQHDSQQPELQAAIRAQLAHKKASHYLPQGLTGGTRHFAAIGG